MSDQEKVNILLVDDRPENLISLAAILDSPGYHLVKAESGREALKALLERDFALILLDVQMPIMDGFETASLIKQREKSKSIPIIFVTAVSLDSPFLFKGYSSGAVDYITKPFDPSILRSKVAVFSDLFRKSSQLKQHAALLRDRDRLERERQIAEIELASLKREQAANEKYRDLVDGIRDGIVWIADLESPRFSFVSEQVKRIFGPFQTGLSFETELLENSKLTEYRKKTIEARDSGNPMPREFGFELQIVQMGGQVRWFQTSVKLAEKSQGGTFEFRGLSVEVTAIKMAQDEAERAIHVRDEFLSIASHELRTPLTPLRLQLEMLQKIVKKGASPETVIQKVLTTLEKSHRQVDRLSRLIEELLDVARINNGKILLKKQLVDLSDIVKDICERFTQEIVRVGSHLELRLEDEIVGDWDKLRVEQIVTNLLTNAIKYGAGKAISISTRKENGVATLVVRDHGIGIRKEDQERIFDLYERAVSPRYFGGLGLGLYIVRQIVEAHDGTISLESDLSQGSTFTVSIPLAAEVEKTGTRPSSGIKSIVDDRSGDVDVAKS